MGLSGPPSGVKAKSAPPAVPATAKKSAPPVRKEPEPEEGPHIQIQQDDQPLSWTTALILFLLAMGTALGALFVMWGRKP